MAHTYTSLLSRVIFSTSTEWGLGLAFMLVACGCHADDADGITRKGSESDRNQDGKPDQQLETFFRDGRKVMTQLSQTNLQGELVTVTWGLHLGGRLVATDSDEDADGHFETIMVMRPDSTDLEVFQRSIDGAVKPAGTNTVSAYQKQTAAFAEFFGKAITAGVEDRLGERLMEETRGKLLAAELEKQGPASISQPRDGEFTTKVFERDSDNDGRSDFRMETFYRGESKVMMITSRPDADGVMAVESRGYLVAGNLVLTEADEDGGGIFETIMATDPETNDIEMFVRKADGSVRPASSRLVEAHKKMFGAVAEFFDEMSDTNSTPADLDDDKIEERIRATQQKIQEAHREITDDKK